MRLTRYRPLRLPRPHWPSKDHRDYQTAGRRWTRRSRDDDPDPEQPGRTERSAGLRPPALSAIVDMRHEGASFEVEIGTNSAPLGGHKPGAGRGMTDASLGAATSGGVASAVEQASSCTVTLTLN